MSKTIYTHTYTYIHTHAHTYISYPNPNPNSNPNPIPNPISPKNAGDTPTSPPPQLAPPRAHGPPLVQCVVLYPQSEERCGLLGVGVGVGVSSSAGGSRISYSVSVIDIGIKALEKVQSKDMDDRAICHSLACSGLLSSLSPSPSPSPI